MAEPSSELSSEALPGATGPEEAESTTPQKQKQAARASRPPRQPGPGSVATYFPRVLKQVPGGLRLSQEAVNVMDSSVRDLLERIAEEAGRLASYTGARPPPPGRSGRPCA